MASNVVRSLRMQGSGKRILALAAPHPSSSASSSSPLLQSRLLSTAVRTSPPVHSPITLSARPHIALQYTSPTKTRHERRGYSSSSSSDSSSSSTSDRPSITQRLRLLFKRYGWWAFGVYNLWSLVDFSLTWALIHWLGADYIRQLESSVRKAVGLQPRESTDAEVAQWPLNGQTPAILQDVTSPPSGHANNEVAASMAYRRLKEGTDDEVAAAGHMVSGQENQKASSGSGTLWAEAVLAYTIHKTLLLPFRVMGTGAVTPSFVKYMVKIGWAKPPVPPVAPASAPTARNAVSGPPSRGQEGAYHHSMAHTIPRSAVTDLSSRYPNPLPPNLILDTRDPSRPRLKPDYTTLGDKPPKKSPAFREWITEVVKLRKLARRLEGKARKFDAIQARKQQASS